METNGEALTDFVCGIAGRKQVCLEEGTHAERIYELLEPLVDEIVVTIPEPSQGNKNVRVMPGDFTEDLHRGTITRAAFKVADRFYSAACSGQSLHRNATRYGALSS